jgi:hypothetical protein
VRFPNLKFRVHWIVDIIKVPCEYISRLLILTGLARDIRLLNRIRIERGLVFIDDGVVTVDPCSLLVI